MIETFLFWLLMSWLLLNLTWAYFTAIMRLRQLRDAGRIRFKDNPALWCFAWPNLIVGLVLDVLVNIVVATPVMMELPKEFLTTARLIRWNHSTRTDWWTRNVRKRFVKLGQRLLDPVDTDGIHIR